MKIHPGRIHHERYDERHETKKEKESNAGPFRLLLQVGVDTWNTKTAAEAKAEEARMDTQFTASTKGRATAPAIIQKEAARAFHFQKANFLAQ